MHQYINLVDAYLKINAIEMLKIFARGVIFSDFQ